MSAEDMVMQSFVEAVTESQSRVLHEAMLDLMLEAEATAIVLCDSGGNILTNTSWQDQEHVESVAALAAGSFAATQALASLAGEACFNSVAHEGTSSSIYIQRIAHEFLLVVQFDKSTSLGLVKHYAEKTDLAIAGLLSIVMENGGTAGHGAKLFEMDASESVFGLPKSASV
ncbi:MAG: putative regulator of Ras-like GTPase activity (Roadblock/LC7/MglB family) [Candidatus Promineifilaceae bacterium]|jgi:predicted regulator of Ras-like GTPase activity (Roadblock/LC7/MglB family)